MKAKSVYNLTSEEKIMMKNVLLSIEVDDDGTIMNIVDAENESDAGGVDEEDEDEDDYNFA